MDKISEIMKNPVVKEMVDILKDMPKERQAYLNGYAAGMKAERELTEHTASA